MDGLRYCIHMHAFDSNCGTRPVDNVERIQVRRSDDKQRTAPVGLALPDTFHTVASPTRSAQRALAGAV